MEVASPAQHPGDEGFTIIEVMVAIVILLVGVLAMTQFITTGLVSTQRTTAREQGTNLARDLLERSRQVPYASTRLDLAPEALRSALPDAGALSGSSFTVRRRNVNYAVTVTACSIDDPSDGAGVGDATFCADPAGGLTPPDGGSTPSHPPPPAAAVNVLGIAVAGGGSLLDIICSAVGKPELLITLAGVSKVTPLGACPSAPSGTVAFDNQPDDLRRVRVDITWTESGRSESLTQSTLLTNPLPNDCPITTPVAPDTLPAGCPTPTS